MANEKFTQLPTVSSSTLADIIAAVQGGVSVQQTLAQVLALVSSSVILHNAGNPNGAVAGTTYIFCWDTTNSILYICTTSGNASTAVWTKVITITAGSGITISQAGATITISASGSGVTWNEVTGTSAAMVSNNAYTASNAALVTLSLPTTSSYGDVIYITGKGAGGWSIAQAAGQQIHIGSSASTVGVGGSVSSTNQYDSVQLFCSVANTTWTTLGGGQGNLTVV